LRPREACKIALPALFLRQIAQAPRHLRSIQNFPPKMTKRTKVLLLCPGSDDGEAIIRELTAAEMKVEKADADSAASLKHILSETSPDVVLCEYVPDRFSACEVQDVLRYESPEIPLIVVAESVTGLTAVKCLRAGAEDIVITQNIRRLPSAIHKAIEKRSPLAKLTARQIEVLRMVAEGHRTREIADRLQLSVKTVESHRGEVMKRLGMHDVVSLVRYALRVGLIPATT
jgi:DNA-binding NarL/FixJ family response regulator